MSTYIVVQGFAFTPMSLPFDELSEAKEWLREAGYDNAYIVREDNQQIVASSEDVKHPYL